jgi:hypothetical protein
MAILVDAPGKVARTSPEPRSPRDQRVLERLPLDRCVSNLHCAIHDRQDIRVDASLLAGRLLEAESSTCASPKVYQVCQDKPVPREPVVGALPQWHRKVGLGLPLEAAADVERIGKVHGSSLDDGLEHGEESVFILIVERAFAQGEDLGPDDLVDGVALELADGLRRGDDDDVLVCDTRLAIGRVDDGQLPYLA